MFDLGYSEFLLIAVVALVVIGPKDLPKALRVVGQWMGKGRAMARHMRSGFDEMMRQSEMEEMEKQWKQHNATVMAEHPADPPMSAREGFTSPPPESAAAPSDEAASPSPATQLAEPGQAPVDPLSHTRIP